MAKPKKTTNHNPRIITAKIVAPPESRATILWMLFVFMGALAVPMLWRSEHFSRGWKYILALLAVCQTLLVFVLLGWVILWFIAKVSVVWSGR